MNGTLAMLFALIENERIICTDCGEEFGNGSAAVIKLTDHEFEKHRGVSDDVHP